MYGWSAVADISSSKVEFEMNTAPYRGRDATLNLFMAFTFIKMIKFGRKKVINKSKMFLRF